MILNKKIGLVLGGGGARGFFHMGVIKALQELKIEVEEISGTSIGAVVGAIYAANPTINFEEISKEFDFLELIKNMAWGIGGKSSEKIEKFLKTYINAEKFEDLKIKFSFNATDINGRKEIIFERGNLYPGLIASISIPGVFPPLKYNNSFLIDGGVINNIPITLIKKPKKIVVADITGPIREINQKSLPIEILYSSIAVMQQNISLEKAKKIKNKKIFYLNLEDDKTFILDFRKKNYQYLIDLGYNSVLKIKNNL